jgi:hypothetical protein
MNFPHLLTEMKIPKKNFPHQILVTASDNQIIFLTADVSVLRFK